MIPKFRAWDTTNKEMFKDTFSITESGQVVVVEQEDVMCPPDYVFVDNLVIMQSTDMVDRDGNIIFDGDIVKMSKDVYSEPTYYEVVRHYGGAYRLESKQHGCELWLRHTDCEVVGNIYENKELLDA
ncbi:YopX family protein [Streptococcus sp. Marseille-Q5855]|uniref:YopX family protein n=1 Tax=Streptococcus sp. Marseille-Q5855 TaxID=2972781 RepID=UPI0021C8522E|nr:YopX family protein [Streptococcus sp. Marseille-Q5855]